MVLCCRFAVLLSLQFMAIAVPVLLPDSLNSIKSKTKLRAGRGKRKGKVWQISHTGRPSYLNPVG